MWSSGGSVSSKLSGTRQPRRSKPKSSIPSGLPAAARRCRRTAARRQCDQQPSILRLNDGRQGGKEVRRCADVSPITFIMSNYLSRVGGGSSVRQDLAQEQLGPIGLRVREELRRRTLLDDLALVHEHHQVG